MNVDDVENVLIMRKQSIIRDRLDYLMGKGDDKTSGIEQIPDHVVNDFALIKHTPDSQ